MESMLGKYIAKTLVVLLSVPILVFYALILSGCTSSTSPGIQNLFLVEFEASTTATLKTPKDLLIRVGYFGICAKFGSHFECVSSFRQSPAALANTFFGGQEPLFADADKPSPTDPQTLAIFSFATTLQTKILLWLLAVSGCLFFLGLVINLVEVGRVFKNKYARTPKTGTRERVKRVSRIIKWVSPALALAATTGITQATGGMQFMASTVSTAITIKAGTATLVLQWFIVGFSFIMAVGKTIVRPLKGSKHNLPVVMGMQNLDANRSGGYGGAARSVNRATAPAASGNGGGARVGRTVI